MTNTSRRFRGAVRSSALVAGLSTIAAILLAAGVTWTTPVVAAPPAHDKVVSDEPSAATPAVNQGAVLDITQVGNTMVAGGTFSTVTAPGGSEVSRPYVFAFDATSGALRTGFAPVLNGAVNAVLPGPTAGTVYVAGEFSTTNGAARSKVVLLDLATGATVASFRAPALNGKVNTIAVSNGRLYVGGFFTLAGAEAHAGLASLSATTGALLPYVNQQVAERHNTGAGARAAIGVLQIDVTSSGDRLVAIGNFRTVDGLPRDQVVMLSLGSQSATVTSDWRTDRYTPLCFNWAVDTYMRDVAFSPDGSYFVIGTTGGHNAGTLCDTASRFETRATGSNIEPTWISDTGGDTLWGVAITEHAVYVGGHQRWMNNPLGSDYANVGAVPRPGLAALDTRTGVPLAWNPGRNPRGQAVYVLYPTPQGLWIGSDTEYIGNRTHRRPRLAFFPLVSGSAVASDATTNLPGTLYLGGLGSHNAMSAVDLTTSGAAVGRSAPDAPIAWNVVRGSFFAGGKLWYGQSDGTFHSRPFAAGAFGPDTTIDPYNDPAWANVLTGSGQTFNGVTPDLYSQMSSIRAMAYANDRIYYVKSGDPTMYSRSFSTDSGIVGPDVQTSEGTQTWDQVRGMFASGGKLYFTSDSDSGASLKSVTLTPRGPTGPLTAVTGPGVADYRAGGFFFAPTATAPTAAPTYVASTRASANLATHAIAMPTGIVAGDRLILAVSLNQPTTVTAPAGWTQVARTDNTGLVSIVWTKVATAADAGASATVTTNAVTKSALVVSAYRGAGAPTATSNIDASMAAHTTPGVTAPNGSRVLSFWADKSATVSSWTVGAAATPRQIAVNAGSGRVSAVVADQAPPEGAVAGVTATADSVSGRGVNWTIVIPSP